MEERKLGRYWRKARKYEVTIEPRLIRDSELLDKMNQANSANLWKRRMKMRRNGFFLLKRNDRLF
jgi:hypothetical protein